ncbi:MAG: MBL fold metallo-hydrolase [Phycisphaerae bacterium]
MTKIALRTTWLGTLIWTILLPGVSLGQSPTPTPKTRLVLLGTGTPNPDPDRWGPALAIVVNKQAYLVDCGPGVVRRAAAARRAGIGALAAHKLTHVFITHLHSDHTLGYPDLIFSPWVLNRNVPLEAFGPPGLGDMTDHLHQAYQQDVRMRIEGLEGANPRGHRVNVHEIQPGLVFEDQNVRVVAFQVRHGSWKHAYGYRFETADRVIVVSGDTAPSENLVKHAKGCDLLVHEVYCQATFDRRPPRWQRYHASFHTSTVQLAEIANRVQPKLLVLTHQLLWGATPQQMLAEITSRYKGPVRFGNDLDVY